MHRYNSSTAVWLRGILQNEYRVAPHERHWLVAEPDIAEESLHPPPEVQVTFISPPRTREHAIELVEAGEIEAALEPYPMLANNPKLRHLVRDYPRMAARGSGGKKSLDRRESLERVFRSRGRGGSVSQRQRKGRVALGARRDGRAIYLQPQ